MEEFFKILLLFELIVIFNVNADDNEVKVQTRIFSGAIVEDDAKYPFVGRLIHGNTWCGAALLSRKWAISSAYCVVKATNINLSFGAIDFRKARIQLNVTKVKVHPYFKSKSLSTHDIALLKFLPIEFSKYVSPILLPPKHLRHEYLDSAWCIVAGYGYYRRPVKVGSNYLRYAKVRIEQSLCPSLWSQGIICGSSLTRLGPGDLGGPLFINKDGDYYLLGIASTIEISADNIQYDQYASVPYDLQWILQTTSINYDD